MDYPLQPVVKKIRPLKQCYFFTSLCESLHLRIELRIVTLSLRNQIFDNLWLSYKTVYMINFLHMKKKLVLFFAISTSGIFAQTPNIDFELGNHNNWVCGTGTFGKTNPATCNEVLPLIITSNTCQDQVPVDGTNTPFDYTQNRHTVMANKTARDPNSNNAVYCVAPLSNFPAGYTNNYSFRIGNAQGSAATGGSDLAMAESIKYTFKVTTANAGLTYMYAAFVKEASPIHPINQAPRFEIKITDQNGTLITCGYYQVIAGDTKGFKDGANDGFGQWKYTDWTKVGLDLTGYIGQNVTIEFRTTDCFPSSGTSTVNGVTTCTDWGPGSHSAYAYIDLYTTPIQIISPPVCANQASVQLCAPAGYATYQWPSGQPGINPPLDQQCVTITLPKAGDVYTVNMTSVAGGCPTSTTITLSGSDFTVKDVAICNGAGPTKLTATPTTTGNYDFKWAPATFLDNPNIQNPTFTPGTTTTYTVTMSDKNLANCNQVKKMTVTVGASFTVSTADAEICEGEQATLTATGADAYTWKDNAGTTLPATPTITVSPTTTTTYTVTGTSATATCPGNPTAIATVTVRKKPVVAVTDQTICVGESAKLNGSVTGGGSTGTWIGGGGTFTPNRSSLTASYKPTPAEETAGTVTLTLESEDPAGPCVKDSKTMTITIVPAVTSDAGPDQNICEGSTVTLSAKFGGAATGGSWTTSGSGTFSVITDPNAVYTPSAGDIASGKVTLKFTVTNGTNSTCPGGIDNMDIIIDKLPTVSAGADQTICIGDAATLGGSIGGSATSATWTGGTGTFSPNNTTLTAKYTPSAAEIAAGKVTLTLTTNAPGKCPAKDSKTTITINPVATVEAGPDQKICIGGTVTLAGIVGGGAVSGSWSGGTGVYAPNSSTANATYTPSKAEEAAGKVILTFTTNDPPGPCPAVSDIMTINIDQLPVAIAGDPGAICAGDQIKLNGKIKGAATEGTWSGGNGVFSKNNKDLTGTYTPTPQEIAAGKVTLKLTTNATGLCPVDVDSVTIIINPNPVIKFAVDTPKACPPHCVDFFDSTTAVGTNIVKWDWDFGIKGGANGTVKNPKEICYTIPGFYDVTLTATSDKGCHSTLKKTEMIETYQVPVANFTANPNPVTLYDPTIHFFDQSTSDVKSWTWNLGDGKIVSPNIKNPTHQYTVGVSGTYMVKLFVVNANGCVDSTRHPVEVLPEFTFFIPNAFTPTRADGTNDTFFGKGVGIVKYHIWIFDRWGNMVFNTADIDTGWDGRANNGVDVAQQDVFVWKVQLTDVFGKKHDYIGTVTIVK
jgi:gliding motility-associated-like protein